MKTRQKVVCAAFVAAVPLFALTAGAAVLADGGRDLDPPALDPALEPAFGPAAASPWRDETAGSAPGATLERARALKAERAAAPVRTPVAAAARMVEVDCTRGRSIQDAIDRNPRDPLVVEVHGICEENVRVERRTLTLRGGDPATDGIRGVVADPPPLAALAILYSDGVAVENLSVSDGPGIGIGMFYSRVAMTNVRAEGNGGGGVHASSGSFLEALEVTSSGNGTQGLLAQRGATVFCTGCVFADNGGFAALASLGGLLTLLDGTVAGERGLRATFGSYADIDCISSTAPVGYPCSLEATAIAGSALADATIAFFAAGEFSGQLQAGDRAHLLLLGARQTATGTTPGGAPRTNFVDQHSTLTAEAFIDEDAVAHESQLKGDTEVAAFSRALLVGETVVDGTLTCERAGDAWADPGVTVTSGGAIVDCEHAALP